MDNLNHNVIVKHIDTLTPNIIYIRTTLPKNISFEAGQYFSIKVAEKINRPYSIASYPGEHTLHFLVDLSPNGPGSQYIKQLKTKDEIEILGPFGFFTLKHAGIGDNHNSLTFIATGTGIAPMRSIIYDLLKNKKSKAQIELYFGLRYETETYMFDEFHALAEKHDNFSFTPVISVPTKTWKGEKGYCQNVFLQKPVNKDSYIFVCGSSNSVNGITEDLVKAGYPLDNIFFEKYG